MKCSTPTFIKGQVFPCGHCIQCRLAKASEWSYRLSCELNYWNYAVFVTLTYREEDCPLGLKKRDLQLFNKRLRKALGSRKIKYFACGEYGPSTARPHYHGIYFGLSLVDKLLIEEAWDKGFITVSNVTEHRIRYVTGYVLKKYGKKENKKNYDEKGIERPFQVCSQGLGLRYCCDNRDVLLDNLGDRYSRGNIALPRYYCRKLDVDSDILRAVSDFRQMKLLEKHNKYSNCKIDTHDIDTMYGYIVHDPSSGKTYYSTNEKHQYQNQAIREIGHYIQQLTNSLFKLREKKHIL